MSVLLLGLLGLFIAGVYTMVYMMLMEDATEQNTQHLDTEKTKGLKLVK